MTGGIQGFIGEGVGGGILLSGDVYYRDTAQGADESNDLLIQRTESGILNFILAVQLFDGKL